MNLILAFDNACGSGAHSLIECMNTKYSAFAFTNLSSVFSFFIQAWLMSLGKLMTIINASRLLSLI